MPVWKIRLLDTRHWIKEKQELFWKSRSTGAALIFGALILVAYWKFFSVPSPGKAVAALALAAAVMTLRQDLSGFEKLSWMVALFAFLYVEIRAIDQDRADSDRKLIQAKKDEDASFATILSQNQAAFNATMSKMQSLADMSRESVDSMTGGDSYPSISSADAFDGAQGRPLLILVHGKHDLVDVAMSVMAHVQAISADIPDSEKTAKFVQLWNSRQYANFPLVVRNQATLLPVRITPQGTQDVYQIEMTCRNGRFSERLTLSQKSGRWLDESYTLTKDGVGVIETYPRSGAKSTSEKK
jgi:hypothetical protein